MPICTSDASAQPLGESENHCHLLHFFVVVFSSIWFCTTCIFEVKGLTVSNIIYKATNIWYKHCPQWRYRCQKNCWPLGTGEGEVQIHSKQINMQSDKCQEENSNEGKVIHFLHACVLSSFSHIQLFVTLWIVACQAPLSLGFSRQEYWSGLPCPSPGDLLDPGIELAFLTSPALASRFFTTTTTWEGLCLF